MVSVRARTCAAGAVTAVVAGVLVDHGAVFGADFPQAAVLGVAAGAVVGLVPHRSPVMRLAGFAAGLLAAWVGYLLRAGMLPDIPLGRAIAAVLVISVITAVATATADRVPLWAGLVGAGTMVGAYEAAYLASPTDVAAESTTAATAALLAAAFGFVATVLVGAVTAVTASPAAPAHAAGAGDDEEIDNSIVLGATPVPDPRVASDVPTTSETNR